MSIKTLLQIILFLLILLIIFSMYFIYFYTGPLNKQISISLDNKNINEKIESLLYQIQNMKNMFIIGLILLKK